MSAFFFFKCKPFCYNLRIYVVDWLKAYEMEKVMGNWNLP